MTEHVIQESQNGRFLAIGHICRVFFENTYISPYVFPVGLTPCRLDQARKLPFISEPVHDTDIVIYRSELDLFRHVPAVEQDQFPVQWFYRQWAVLRIAVPKVLDLSVYTVLDHIVFEVFQFFVYSDVSEPFRFINIVELAEDDIEGLGKAVEVDDLLSVLSGALCPEIRVDQYKGFC